MTHPYWARSGLSRRINGFFSYALCAIWSIFAPERVDWALYQELKEQFEEKQ